MAKFTGNIGDEYTKKLNQLATSDEISKRAIYGGAGIVADAIKANTPTDTGSLRGSLGISRIKLDKDGNWNAKIGFDGYDEKGTPNSLKARAIESGTSKIKKHPFVRPAVKATKNQASDAMKKVIDDEIKKIMK